MGHAHAMRLHGVTLAIVEVADLRVVEVRHLQRGRQVAVRRRKTSLPQILLRRGVRPCTSQGVLTQIASSESIELVDFKLSPEALLQPRFLSAQLRMEATYKANC